MYDACFSVTIPNVIMHYFRSHIDHYACAKITYIMLPINIASINSMDTSISVSVRWLL